MKAPLTMPVGGARQQEFELQRLDLISPEAGGRLNSVQAGFPLWTATWTLTDMLPAKSDEWRGFMSRCRGSIRRFLGYDRKRPFPKLYPAGFGAFGAFTGTAASWSETITSDGDSQVTLNLGAAAAGLVLSQGDYIGFRWTATETAVAGLTWHAPVRVDIGGAADGSGIVTVTSEPPIPLAVPGTATAYLDHPKCVMALDSNQSKLEAIDRRDAIKGGSIVGVQDIRS